MFLCQNNYIDKFINKFNINIIKKIKIIFNQLHFYNKKRKNSYFIKSSCISTKNKFY